MGKEWRNVSSMQMIVLLIICLSDLLHWMVGMMGKVHLIFLLLQVTMELQLEVFIILLELLLTSISITTTISRAYSSVKTIKADFAVRLDEDLSTMHCCC